MRVFKKGADVRERLTAIEKKTADITVYANQLATKAMHERFHQNVALASWDGSGYRIDYSAFPTERANDQLRSTLEALVPTVQKAQQVREEALKWLPFLKDDDLVELSIDELQLFGLDNDWM